MARLSEPIGAIVHTNAAAYSSFAAALMAAGAGTLYAPPGTYPITVPMTPAAGASIELHPNAVLQQATKWTPAFDLLDVPGVSIFGGQYRYEGDRSGDTSASFRNDGMWGYSAAVWTNSDDTRVTDIAVYGFESGVYVSGWNGTTLADYHTKNVTINGVTIDTVDFAVLATGTENLRVGNVTGAYVQAPTGSIAPPPAHLVYLSDAAKHRTPEITSCVATGGVNTHAYLFKGVNGGTARGLFARNCAALLSLLTSDRMTIADIGFEAGTGWVGYLIDLQDTGTTRIVIDRAQLLTPNADKLVSFAGSDCTLRGLQAENAWGTVETSTVDILIQGTRHTIEDIRLNNTGAGAHTGIQLNTGTDHRVINPTILNCNTGVRIVSGVSASVEYDPARITFHASATDKKTIRQQSTGGRARLPATRTQTDLSVGQGVTPDPMRNTVTGAHILGNSYAINAPLADSSAPGHTHTVEIYNDSGGATAGIWNAAWLLASAWSDPANGAKKFITFVFDGTSWRELGRSA